MSVVTLASIQGVSKLMPPIPGHNFRHVTEAKTKDLAVYNIE